MKVTKFKCDHPSRYHSAEDDPTGWVAVLEEANDILRVFKVESLDFEANFIFCSTDCFESWLRARWFAPEPKAAVREGVGDPASNDVPF
jgi:hypothetical protein